MRLLRLLCLFPLIILVGCATVPMQKLETKLTESDKAEYVVILLEQSEVAVDDADVGNAGGGLIGALIEAGMESAMTKNRQKAIAPLRDALLDFDYEAKLIESVQSRLPTALVRADAPIKILRSQAQWREHLREVIPSNVLLITMHYGFEQNFDIAYVYANVDLSHHHAVPPDPESTKKMSKADREAAERKILHSGFYYSQSVTRPILQKFSKVAGEARYETDAKRWAVNQAEPARAAFSTALDEIASLISRDAERQLPSPSEEKGPLVGLASKHIGTFPQRMPVLSQANGRSLVYLHQGWYWVDDRQIRQ